MSATFVLDISRSFLFFKIFSSSSNSYVSSGPESEAALRRKALRAHRLLLAARLLLRRRAVKDPCCFFKNKIKWGEIVQKSTCGEDKTRRESLERRPSLCWNRRQQALPSCLFPPHRDANPPPPTTGVTTATTITTAISPPPHPPHK